MIRVSLCVALLFCISQFLHAQHQLEGFFPVEGGALTIRTTQGPIQAGGLDLKARIGSLSNGSNAAPWAFYITGNDRTEVSQVVMGSLGTPPTLDGSLTLDVSASAGAIIDGAWGNGPTPVSFPINGSLPGDINGPLAGGLNADFPYDGGPITITPRGTVRATGLSLEATSGSLTSAGSAAPFSSIDVNTASQWSVSSGAEVTIDGAVTLDVLGSPAATIFGSVTNGEASRNFNVTRLDVTRTSALKATFQAAGGPISLESTLGPVVTRSIDITRNISNGWLESGGSPAPYASLDAATAGRWSASSTADVVIDGKVTLDVTANASLAAPNALTGLVFDGSTTQAFDVTPEFDASAARLEGFFPVEGGAITVRTTQGPINAGGLDFQARVGTLSNGSNPAPFQFYLTGNDMTAGERVTMASLGVYPKIDGTLTLDVSASAGAIIEASWGDGVTPAPFPMNGVLNGGGIDPPSGELLGSYPFSGGSVSLHTRGGPVSVSSLELTATKGHVVGGTNAAPFEQVSTNSDTVWAVSSSSEVVIDGVVVLDVQAGENSVLAGTADGAEFLMNGVGSQELAADILAIFPEGGGPITLVAPNGPVEAAGLELNTEVGQLIAGDNAEPFSFFVNSALNQIVLGTLDDPILIDGPVTLDIVASSDATITGSFGNPDGTLVAVSMPLQAVPEPASGLLAFIALATATLFRRQR